VTAAGITREELLTQGFDDLASKPITGNELRAVFGAHFKA
jgi:DNA-binding response OmpR family regulator